MPSELNFFPGKEPFNGILHPFLDWHNRRYILSKTAGLFPGSSSVFVDYDGYQDYEIDIEEIGPETAPGKEQGQYGQYRPGIRVAETVAEVPDDSRTEDSKL